MHDIEAATARHLAAHLALKARPAGDNVVTLRPVSHTQQVLWHMHAPANSVQKLVIKKALSHDGFNDKCLDDCDKVFLKDSLEGLDDT